MLQWLRDMNKWYACCYGNDAYLLRFQGDGNHRPYHYFREDAEYSVFVVLVMMCVAVTLGRYPGTVRLLLW